MAKIVEILGPPGVGKSTLFKEVINKWHPKSNWIPAYRLVTINPELKKYPFNYYFQLLRKKLGKPLTDRSTIEEDVSRFLHSNSEFSKFCWDSIDKNKASSHLTIDDRFRSAFHLFSVFASYQVISESLDKRLALTDEFLTHRIVQITDESVNENEIQKFVSLIPKPEIIVLLDAPNEVLVERINSRRRSIIRHKERSESDLFNLSNSDRRKLQITCDYLEESGVRIVKIDTTNDLVSNVDFLTNYLTEYEGKS